ncbi:hypothetical protein CHO01_22710 [Cellulomonas hominis]|uniref:Uncharacterized protein n=1 Tax=Cellulomonas hominis TaxID=156981 RepID=A0A511FD24_9CELL|nr:hypothetical protein [Cellulomonas hominis]MBB5474601.1 hypothetical protein [Cellulomonas hominis]NKY05474.1 hypothetical protein [Cellulomonas hominis]GEL47155.1 hypothetical protein CHO01_22710 [Cellulomonas hominis]
MSALAMQARTARVMAAARWRELRTAGARTATWAGFLLCLGMIAVTAKIGDLVREMARIATSEGRSSRSLLALVEAHPQTVWGLAVIAAAATSLVSLIGHPRAPRLLAVAYGSLAPTGTLARFLESLAASSISVVPAVQLAVLAGAASLLTAEGEGRGRAIAAAWATVVVLHLGQCAVTWAGALLPRGRRGRLLAVAGAAVVVVGCFAASDRLALAAWWLLLGAGVGPWVTLCVLAVSALVVALLACRATANLPPARIPGQARSVRIPPGPVAACRRSMLVSAWRIGSVRSGALLTLAGCVVVVVAARSTAAAVSTGLVLPLAWGLTFTANFLAVLGRGALWVAAQPAAAGALARAGVEVALLVPGAGAGMLALVFAAASPSHLGAFVMTAVPANVLLAALAVRRAIRRPVGAGVDRGSALVPDSTALVELVRLAVAAGLVWITVNWPMVFPVGADHLLARITASLGWTALGACMLAGSVRSWPDRRARALALAGAA